MCEQCGCGQSEPVSTFEDKVKEVIEGIRPALQGHGGDIELIGTDNDNNVKVRLQGACHGCPSATMTMKLGVERILKEQVPEVNNIIAVD